MVTNFVSYIFVIFFNSLTYNSYILYVKNIKIYECYAIVVVTSESIELCISIDTMSALIYFALTEELKINAHAK